MNIKNWRTVKKAISAAVGAALVTIPLVWDGNVEAEEAVAILSAWASAFGVYQVRNS